MPPNGGNELPILDRAAAVQSMGGDESIFESFIDLFIEESAQNVAEIEDAIAQGDAERLERAAHNLRGAAATMHAERMREAAHRLELAGRKGDLSDASAALPYLMDELAALEDHVRTR